jgi:hypothetical protein
MEKRMQTAQEFYGASYAKAKDTTKLDNAFAKLNLALKSENEGIQRRALDMAAKAETEAFAS